jgi:prepilin-type N-terminal cleavage/methylation domain-containing protein
MMNRRLTSAVARGRGFTLVELLVAVVLSSLVLLAVYSVSTNASQTFRVQNDATEATDQLNFAMDLIKTDLRRASYLSVPNGQLETYANGVQVCGSPPATIIQALRVDDNFDSWVPPATDFGETAILMVDGTPRSPDRLRLLGAYRTDRSYPVSITQPTEIRAIHGFGEGVAISETQVSAISIPMFSRAILAVYSKTDAVQFVRTTTGATEAVPGQADTIRIPIRDGITDYGGELCDFGSPWAPGRRVVPLHFVEYSIQRDPDNPNSTVLVREELGYDGTVLDRIVVGSNIVDFQVWFDSRAGEVGTPLTNMQNDGTIDDDQGTSAMTALDGTAAARPELVRYAHVQISARLQNPIEGLEGVALEDGLRDRVEVVEYNSAGEAIQTGEFTRVLTIRTETELTNFGLAD